MTRNIVRRAVMLAALISLSAGVALAQGGPPFGGPPFAGGQGGPPFASGQGGPPGPGWRQGPPGYSSEVQVDRTKVEAAAKAALQKATKGAIWTSPRGPKMTPIVVDKEVVGQLWEDADPKTLSIGSYWTAPGSGLRVQLVKDGKIIGMLWVDI